MTRPRLTGRARKDLEDIRTYTIDRWDRAQWLRYFASISAAFQRIADDPLFGRPRDALHIGLRSLTHGQHVIFFNPTRHARGAVVIVGIIHERQNLDALTFTDDLDP